MSACVSPVYWERVDTSLCSGTSSILLLLALEDFKILKDRGHDHKWLQNKQDREDQFIHLTNICWGLVWLALSPRVRQTVPDFMELTSLTAGSGGGWEPDTNQQTHTFTRSGPALVNWGLHLLVDFKWRDWQRLLWGRGFRTEVWASDPFSRPRVEPGSPTLQADSLSSEPSGKPKNTGVGCHALLQGIFPAQGWNPRLLPLLHPQGGSLSLAPPGKRLYHSD